MSKKNSIREFVPIISVLLVLILIFTLIIYRVSIRNHEKETEIFEIKNTKEVYNYPDSKVVTIMKHYMITNPPEDLQERKELVERFSEDNPVDREESIDINKERHYEVYFYRESKRLPKNWQPNEAYFNIDRIEHHTDDAVAVVRWTDSNQQKRYTVMKKSKNKVDYGSLIDQICF